MDTLQRLVLFCLLITYMLQQCDGYAYRTWTRKRTKLGHLLSELYVDANAKFESIQYMKRYFGRSSKYHLGAAIYNARQLHDRMVRMYEFFHDNHNKLHLTKKALHMTEVHRLFMEVDHIVQMCVEYDRIDPSGRLFGRMGARPEEVKDVEQSTREEKKKKFRDYMARRKIEWDMLNGNKNATLTKDLSSKDKEGEGFASDVD